MWTRHELDRRSRRLLNLDMLADLHRLDELTGHTRSAITNGVNKAKIRECYFQVAVYLGMPVGLGCFNVATKVFAEMARRPPSEPAILQSAHRPSDARNHWQCLKNASYIRVQLPEKPWVQRLSAVRRHERASFIGWFDSLAQLKRLFRFGSLVIQWGPA